MPRIFTQPPAIPGFFLPGQVQRKNNQQHGVVRLFESAPTGPLARAPPPPMVGSGDRDESNPSTDLPSPYLTELVFVCWKDIWGVSF